MINSMVMEFKSGKMVQVIRVIISMEKSMEKVNFHGQMDRNFKGTFLKMGYKAKEFINGRMEENI